jgi:hypothetical protein
MIALIINYQKTSVKSGQTFLDMQAKKTREVFNTYNGMLCKSFLSENKILSLNNELFIPFPHPSVVIPSD